jgi:hypothetical protein
MSVTPTTQKVQTVAEVARAKREIKRQEEERQRKIKEAQEEKARLEAEEKQKVREELEKEEAKAIEKIKGYNTYKGVGGLYNKAPRYWFFSTSAGVRNVPYFEGEVTQL